MQLPQLRRVRWAVRAALVLGVAASVAANVLHARPNPISQAISAWPPLALLLTVELTSRIPMYRRALAACRVFATVAIAGIAAWVSYWHMKGVAVRYGEVEVSAYLLPISVDGLIVVASVSLVELAGRIRVIEDQRAKAARAAAQESVPTAPPRTPQPVRIVEPGPAITAANVPELMPDPGRPYREPAPLATAQPADATPAPASDLAELDQLGELAEIPDVAPVSPAVPPISTAGPDTQSFLGELGVGSAVATPKHGSAHANGSKPPGPRGARAAMKTPTRTVVTSPTRDAIDPSAPRQRRPKQETADLANEIEALNPDISETELAKRLGITPSYLRAVRRDLRPATARR